MYEACPRAHEVGGKSGERRKESTGRGSAFTGVGGVAGAHKQSGGLG